MKKPSSQAETHSGPAGPPRSFHRSVRAVAILQHLFFLFIYRLQAQAHSGPESLLRGSRKDLFFLFIFRLQAQANATQEAADPVHFFLYIL